MKLVIIPADSQVGVDGVFRAVSMAGIDPDIHAVQFNGNSGHVEFDSKDNQKITDISAYQVFVDRWTAAAPPAPVTPATKDFSQLANATKQLRAAVLVAAQFSGRTSDEAAAAFKTAFDSL